MTVYFLKLFNSLITVFRFFLNFDAIGSINGIKFKKNVLTRWLQGGFPLYVSRCKSVVLYADPYQEKMRGQRETLRAVARMCRSHSSYF